MIQYSEFIHVLAKVGVVRKDMKGVPDTALRISGIAEFLRHQQCGDPRNVGLPGKNPEIEHQFNVLFKVPWNRCRRRRHFQIGQELLPDFLNAPLDFPHII